ncbi:Fe2+ transport system protein A [Lacticaseibacillus paracasei subsp. paracasei Lpp22]|uniref:Fe2+ transport system protein A n=1 Tax=Lacticaseibacillus paracasei subsp. paracasei Lpp22 TaxID=1256221 RepID=A0A8E0IAT4_LACPA|nr:Fe2+ transport system protein A [Lacticaseibacillus paracasei subsp. paracasei Lpp22]
MQALIDVRESGAYLLMSVGGSGALRRHLAEMGLVVGKKVTVVKPASKLSGMVIFFQGQRLAISDEIASLLVVRPFAMDADTPAIALADLPLRQAGLIRTIKGDPPLRHRLMDMGLTKGTLVKIHQIAPLGDPIELAVRGYKLSIRKQDAAHVLVTEVTSDGDT